MSIFTVLKLFAGSVQVCCCSFSLPVLSVNMFQAYCLPRDFGIVLVEVDRSQRLSDRERGNLPINKYETTRKCGVSFCVVNWSCLPWGAKWSLDLDLLRTFRKRWYVLRNGSPARFSHRTVSKGSLCLKHLSEDGRPWPRVVD